MPATAFKAEALSGGLIHFPTDYKGKIVLLDFWATWCPPCRAEIPQLIKAYDQFKDQGFEIVGVTLDAFQRVSASRVRTFAAEQKMGWQQIYSGAEPIATKYGVRGIPAAFLVDGDTGTILASGRDVRGDALLATIRRNLKGRR